jgi:hypothetical protein
MGHYRRLLPVALVFALAGCQKADDPNGNAPGSELKPPVHDSTPVTATGKLRGLHPAGRSATTADETLPSAKAPETWPKYENGRYLERTFRFRPSSIEFRPTGAHVPITAVVFRIEDKDIPADHFIVGIDSSEAAVLKDAIAADDGHITVVADWVNLPTKREDWRGAPELWAEGRPLLGKLVRPQIKKRVGGPG